MAVSNDRRVRRTRAVLQRALQELVLQKRYESITITEILDRADVGRSTFYTHFTDKDDLLLSALDHITAEVDAAMQTSGELNTAPLFAHAGTHVELYQALSRGPAGSLFLRKLGDHLAERIRATLPPDGNPRHDLRARYDAAGIIAALTWWLDHTDLVAADDAANVVHDLRTIN